jgi:DNA-binding PadR family transcriptional regulator
MSSREECPADFIPLSNLSFHVLLALGAGASHGYALGKEIERQSEGRLNPATGSLYQALRRLREAGLIREAGRPKRINVRDARRQYFELAPLGREVFLLETRRLESLLLAAREVNLMPA